MTFLLGFLVGVLSVLIGIAFVCREADRGASWLHFVAPRWAAQRRLYRAWCVHQVKLILDGIHTRDVQ